MQRELADFIIQACENCDTFFEDMPTIRENYSGRGMYGKETTAIVCQNIMPVMAAIACELNDTAELWLLDFSKIRHLKMDSMGRSSIVLY